jgi:NAD+ diphosphatase
MVLGVYLNNGKAIWLEANNTLPAIAPASDSHAFWPSATREFYVVQHSSNLGDITATGSWVNVRSSFGTLPSAQAVMVAHALQLAAFDQQTLYCHNCAAKLTNSMAMPISKQCSGCGQTVYPNINPAIIVAIYCNVRRQVLLQQPVRVPAVGFYSAVAGFVELGETLEQAAAREVSEEIGVRIKNIRYQQSQSWPVGAALMLGFIAEYDQGDIVLDPVEVADARFFDLDQLPELPPANTIAYQLIQRICQQLAQEGG